MTDIRKLVGRLKSPFRSRRELEAYEKSLEVARRRLEKKDQKLKQVRQQLAEKHREIVELRAMSSVDGQDTGIKPGKIVWMLGSGRTGSTWLSRMMGELEGHTIWFEPLVGKIFGHPATTRIWDWQRERKNFILSTSYKKVWLKAIRNFVLDGANARFPKVAERGYLIIKEPNGSIGAPLLMEALPESRMIFLIRDPRDIVASSLDARKKGSWTSTIIEFESDEDTLADRDPDASVKELTNKCLMNLEKVKQAYDAHEGRKVLVRYEDLRHDALGELKRIYSSLDIPIEEEQLRLAVEKHAWENIPDSQKGPGKVRRKAKPGGWREDLTREQVRIVEKTTASILEEFYGD